MRWYKPLSQYHRLIAYASSDVQLLADKRAQSFNDLYEFEPGEEDSKWTLVHASNPPPSRARHAAFELDECHMLVFGGVDKHDRFADLWIYNCQTRAWKEVEAQGYEYTDENGASSIIRPHARAHFTATKFFDHIIIFGGYGGAGIVHGDLWILNLAYDDAGSPSFS
jgi:hypothetical protein